MGVVRWRSALHQAQANGCDAAYVRALCEHFAARPGAWAAGALHFRVRGARPDVPPHEAWPKPSEAWTLRDARERRDAAELERRFGAQLDALDAEAANALSVRVTKFPAHRIQREGKFCGLFRDALLEALRDEGSGDRGRGTG